MPHSIRQNPLTGQWVVFSPSRGRRPHNLVAQSGQESRVSPETCPFCPGHEDQLPPIIADLPGPSEPWQTRVIPNLYPALRPDAPSVPGDAFYDNHPAEGHHEVVIETPRHYGDVPDRAPDEIAALLRTYRDRFNALRRKDARLIPFVFRNYGRRAGASQPHPHSQIIATPVVPPILQVQDERARAFLDERDACLLCDVMRHERKDGRRVIADNEAFLAVVPYAAMVPFEMHILPRRCHPDFGTLTDDEADLLARLLLEVLYRHRSVLGHIAYNLVIQPGSTYRGENGHGHWHLFIRPRGLGNGGFELGTGMMINASLPEDDAAALREVASNGSSTAEA